MSLQVFGVLNEHARGNKRCEGFCREIAGLFSVDCLELVAEITVLVVFGPDIVID